MASALFSRLFDLMSGLTEPGWLRTMATSATVTPARRRCGGGSPCGFTMMTTDGVGQRRRIVGELADAAGEQDADVGFAAGRAAAGGAHRLADRAQRCSSSVSGTAS